MDIPYYCLKIELSQNGCMKPLEANQEASRKSAALSTVSSAEFGRLCFSRGYKYERATS